MRAALASMSSYTVFTQESPNVAIPPTSSMSNAVHAPTFRT
jgi:hypothetical protein